VNQATIDPSLKRIGTHYPVDYAILDLFAGVFHLVNASSYLRYCAVTQNRAVELQLQCCRLMANAPSPFRLLRT